MRTCRVCSKDVSRDPTYRGRYCREHYNENHKKRHHNNKERYYHRREDKWHKVAYTYARRRWIETPRLQPMQFDITPEFLLEQWDKQDGKCFYTGVEMCKQHSHPYKVSLDRRDSSKGYICSNVVLTTKFCNVAKNKYSEADFMQMLKDIYVSIG